MKAREAAECEMAEATALVTEIRQLAQAHHDEVAVKRAEKAAMAERLSGATAISIRIKDEREELLTRSSSVSAQQTAIQAEEADLATQSEDLQRQQVESLRAERETSRKAASQLDREWKAKRGLRTAEVDDVLREGTAKPSASFGKIATARRSNAPVTMQSESICARRA